MKMEYIIISIVSFLVSFIINFIICEINYQKRKNNYGKTYRKTTI